MLKPENVFEIAGEIVKTQSPFLRTLNTGKKTLEIIQRGVDNKELGGPGRILIELVEPIQALYGKAVKRNHSGMGQQASRERGSVVFVAKKIQKK